MILEEAKQEGPVMASVNRISKGLAGLIIQVDELLARLDGVLAQVPNQKDMVTPEPPSDCRLMGLLAQQERMIGTIEHRLADAMNRLQL